MKYWYLAALSVVLGILLAVVEKKQKFKAALAVKTLASAAFVALGILSYLTRPEPAGILILIGLVLGAVGDVLLNIRHLKNGNLVFFYIGGVSFFFGHLLYLAAFIPFAAPHLPAAIVFGIAFAAAITLAEFSFTRGTGMMRIAGAVYILTVSLMASVAVFAAIRQRFALPFLLRAIGGCLFLISDSALFFRMMKNESGTVLAFLVLLTYYPAQCLIAASMAF